MVIKHIEQPGLYIYNIRRHRDIKGASSDRQEYRLPGKKLRYALYYRHLSRQVQGFQSPVLSILCNYRPAIVKHH